MFRNPVKEDLKVENMGMRHIYISTTWSLCICKTMWTWSFLHSNLFRASHRKYPYYIFTHIGKVTRKEG